MLRRHWQSLMLSFIFDSIFQGYSRIKDMSWWIEHRDTFIKQQNYQVDTRPFTQLATTATVDKTKDNFFLLNKVTDQLLQELQRFGIETLKKLRIHVISHWNDLWKLKDTCWGLKQIPSHHLLWRAMFMKCSLRDNRK